MWGTLMPWIGRLRSHRNLPRDPPRPRRHADVPAAGRQQNASPTQCRGTAQPRHLHRLGLASTMCRDRPVSLPAQAIEAATRRAARSGQRAHVHTGIGGDRNSRRRLLSAHCGPDMKVARAVIDQGDPLSHGTPSSPGKANRGNPFDNRQIGPAFSSGLMKRVLLPARPAPSARIGRLYEDQPRHPAAPRNPRPQNAPLMPRPSMPCELIGQHRVDLLDIGTGVGQQRCQMLPQLPLACWGSPPPFRGSRLPPPAASRGQALVLRLSQIWVIGACKAISICRRDARRLGPPNGTSVRVNSDPFPPSFSCVNSPSTQDRPSRKYPAATRLKVFVHRE